MTSHAVSYFATGTVPSRMGSFHPSVAPYGAYPTQDGYLVVALAFEAHWITFCTICGEPDLANDPRLISNAIRIANRDCLDEHDTQLLSNRTTQEWTDIMDSAGIPCSPINTLDTVLGLPQSLHQGYVVSVSHPDIDNFRMPGLHIRLSDTMSRIRLAPPSLGQHSREILREAGYSEDTIDELQSTGII
ncbi:hypothetical protein BH23CHL5_BH23CHL5_18380 [soil metagenome]